MPTNRSKETTIIASSFLCAAVNDDVSDGVGRRAGRTRARLNYALMAALFAVVFVRSNITLKSSSSSSSSSRSSSSVSSTERKDHREHWHNGQAEAHVQKVKDARNQSNSTLTSTFVNGSITSSSSSSAPLFYHISPGSTGSRTLYHAACSSGFPSVHHKSYCISRTKGINGVDETVVRGVRSHFEVMRLYQMAATCCKLWNRGWIEVDGDGNVIAGHDGDNGGNDKYLSVVGLQLCSTPLDEWSNEIQTHLKSIIQSGLVGLFDTPYPYLSHQILELGNNSQPQSHYRKVPPIIAMTERDPRGWASSRSKNHELLLCKDEYSPESLGSSEFDVLGCASRARATASHIYGDDDNVNSTEPLSKALRFWDVFRYRSHKDEAPGEAFQLGMERQMERHQNMYLPLAEYAPDVFGVHSAGNETADREPVKEKDVAADIRRLIFGRKKQQTSPSQEVVDGNTNDGIDTSLGSTWRKSYAESLTCRGRVDWDIKNDAMIEYYHLPKTCGVPFKKKTQDAKIKKNDDGGMSDIHDMTPLIPVV